MDRTHTIEVMDYPWFPSSLRTCMTNNIIVIARLMGVPGVLGELVSRVLREHELRHIVDLSSGGGGSMPEVLQAVRTEPGLEEVGLTLTDLYPNDEAVDRFQGEGGVTYLRAPVDATDLGSAPVELLKEPSLMVMCNAFHHMRPEGAREILKSAHDAKQPLLIYEMGTHLPAWLWVVSMPLALPLVALTGALMSLMVRPFTFRQLFFTFVVPLVPLFYAWDGNASAPRIYTPADLEQLRQGLNDGYRWEEGPATDASGKARGRYLLGVPTST